MGIIELDKINFRYEKEEALVLRDFDMSVQPGECVVIEGDNGSGKTTLFRVLSGLAFPESGEFCFDGVKITGEYMKDNARSKLFHKRVGYLFQDPDIMLFNARVYDEVAFGPRQMGLTDEETDERTRDCLELFGLSELSDKAPYHLSGGQKKRVALAAVMALNPDVLLLDEPYAGLDRKTQASLTRFLSDLKKSGKTLIVATHNGEALTDIADRIISLSAPDDEH